MARAPDWPALRNKPTGFFDRFVKSVTLEHVGAGDEVFREEVGADSQVVILSSCKDPYLSLGSFACDAAGPG